MKVLKATNLSFHLIVSNATLKHSITPVIILIYVGWVNSEITWPQNISIDYAGFKDDYNDLITHTILKEISSR